MVRVTAAFRAAIDAIGRGEAPAPYESLLGDLAEGARETTVSLSETLAMSGLMELAIGPLLFNWPAERVEAFMPGSPTRPRRNGLSRRGRLRKATAVAAGRPGAGCRAAGSRGQDGDLVHSRPSLHVPGAAAGGRAGRGSRSSDQAGDMSAVWSRAPAPFVAGPLLNVYNAPAAAELVRMGCVRLCANVELPPDLHHRDRARLP